MSLYFSFSNEFVQFLPARGSICLPLKSLKAALSIIILNGPVWK